MYSLRPIMLEIDFISCSHTLAHSIGSGPRADHREPMLAQKCVQLSWCHWRALLSPVSCGSPRGGESADHLSQPGTRRQLRRASLIQHAILTPGCCNTMRLQWLSNRLSVRPPCTRRRFCSCLHCCTLTTTCHWKQNIRAKGRRLT
jgi:hypothetical protein